MLGSLGTRHNLFGLLQIAEDAGERSRLTLAETSRTQRRCLRRAAEPVKLQKGYIWNALQGTNKRCPSRYLQVEGRDPARYAVRAAVSPARASTAAPIVALLFALDVGELLELGLEFDGALLLACPTDSPFVAMPVTSATLVLLPVPVAETDDVSCSTPPEAQIV